jgi:hypothetical protein
MFIRNYSYIYTYINRVNDHIINSGIIVLNFRHLLLSNNSITLGINSTVVKLLSHRKDMLYPKS